MWIVWNLIAFGNTQEMTEVNENKLLLLNCCCVDEAK